MKLFSQPKRLIACLFLLTLSLSMAACNHSPKPDSSESSSALTSSIPAFINPLPDLDLTTFSPPTIPTTEILTKINTAYNQNNDVVGWLSVDGTDINAEVLQGNDNNIYERSDITKAYNWYGCYFADYENTFGDRNALSKNTIIYGHNMTDNPDDVRFAQLMRYIDPKFAKSHPYIRFSTPEDDMVFKIFAVSFTETELPFVYTSFPNKSKMDFMDLMEEIRARSIYDYDVDLNTNDKTMILSTCTYRYGERTDQRYLIVGRLARPDEDISAQTVTLTMNEDVKPPQFKN